MSSEGIDWRFIPGVKDKYLVSRRGEIWSIPSKRILKNVLTGRGYHQVTLCGKSRFVHRLVMGSFSPVENMEELGVNHKNGVKTDNRVENLEWCTPEENNKHARETGLMPCSRGRNNVNNKLTEEDVRQIKDMKGKANWTRKEIADFYGVHTTTIRDIWSGKAWSWLK